MSFSFNFTASSLSSARSKLAAAYAPAAVKAVVELALASIREPTPPAMTRAVDAKSAGAGAGVALSGGQSASSTSPRLVGVFVEAWGHIDECNGTSQIQKFEVRPLFD